MGQSQFSSSIEKTLGSGWLFSAMLVGTVCGVSVLGTTILALWRNKRVEEEKVPMRRHSVPITEMFQVDMVDRRLRSTSVDCSLDMSINLGVPSSASTNTGQVLSSPIHGLSATHIL